MTFRRSTHGSATKKTSPQVHGPKAPHIPCLTRMKDPRGPEFPHGVLRDCSGRQHKCRRRQNNFGAKEGTEIPGGRFPSSAGRVSLFGDHHAFPILRRRKRPEGPAHRNSREHRPIPGFGKTNVTTSIHKFHSPEAAERRSFRRSPCIAR